jgi:FkbM family methyltransferase
MIEKISAPFILGDGLFQKIKFFCIIVIFFLQHKYDFIIKPFYRIRLRGRGKAFFFYPTDGSDVGVLREIFIKNEYAISGLNPQNILDIGSNVGVSVIFFKLVYPGANIYAFEPDPIVFGKLKRNTEQFTNIHLYNYAISDINGALDFYVYPESSMSSSLYRRSDKQKKIKVISKKLSDIVNEINLKKVDLLKFDVEGAEFAIFKDGFKHKYLKYLIGEVHEDISDKSIGDFLALFPEFKIIKKELALPGRYIVELANQ